MMGRGKLGRFKGFLLSTEAVTVYSAVIITPITTAIAQRFGVSNRFPAWAFLLIVAFVLFVIAGMMSGMARAIALGAALGTFLNAIFASRFGAALSARLASLQATVGA